QPPHLDALAHRDRQQSPLVGGRSMHLVEIFGDDADAGNCGITFGDQDRRGTRRIEREEGFAPFPGPLFHQAQIKSVFAEDQADEARMRAERVMVQRVHEVLDLEVSSWNSWVSSRRLRNPQPIKAAPIEWRRL